MRAFWHQNDFARIAARFMRRADRKNSAQLAMGTRLGAHRNTRHAGERLEPLAELVNHFERTLHRLLRCKRVDVGEPWQARHLLVEPRIVLHRA